MEYRLFVEEKLKALLEPAFRDVPACEANAAIARARREQAGGDPEDDDAPIVRSYEVVLSTWEHFATEQVPKLVYHLESVGARLPDCRGVMISAFAGERLYFVEAREFLARACVLLGVSPAQLVERHGLGERRTAVSDPLLLPGPKGRN